MAARRSLFAMSLLGLSLALAGCESMDPAYWIPDNKKKLPGDRREVFPEGVPGVVQGVPPELVKGNNALMEPEPAPQAAAPAPVEEKPKPKARPSREARPAQPAAEPQPQQRTQAAPRPAQPAATGAWPSPQPQTAQQPQAAPSPSGWPAPPPSGTFTR